MPECMDWLLIKVNRVQGVRGLWTRASAGSQTTTKRHKLTSERHKQPQRLIPTPLLCLSVWVLLLMRGGHISVSVSNSPVGGSTDLQLLLKPSKHWKYSQRNTHTHVSSVCLIHNVTHTHTHTVCNLSGGVVRGWRDHPGPAAKKRNCFICMWQAFTHSHTQTVDSRCFSSVSRTMFTGCVF